MAPRKKKDKKSDEPLLDPETAPVLTATIDTTDLRLTAAQYGRVHEFLEWYKTMEGEAAKGQFCFPDLPSEIRNNIYSMALSDDTGIVNLSQHALPVASRVCRQFRQEVLPLFFAETPFHVAICSNFSTPWVIRRNLTIPIQRYWNRKDRPSKNELERCGRLRIKQVIKNAIRLAQGSALFRNITLRVYNSRHEITERIWCDTNYVVMFITLRVQHNGLHVSVERGHRHPSHPDYERIHFGKSYEAQDVDGVIAAARTVIDEIGNRAGFNGFHLRDLEKIARSFRIPLPAAEDLGEGDQA